jgi:hypothetical protein
MTRSSDWENRGPEFRAGVNADQAEIGAIRFGSCNVEAGIADERTADAMDDFEIIDPEGVESWADADSRFDTATSEIGDEIRRREEMLGGSYPFRLEGNTLAYCQSNTLAYEFCLAVSQSPSLSEGSYKRFPPAFERLARDVVMCFLGPGAEGYRTGWPRDSFEDRPAKFRAVVNRLHELTDEWIWSPAPGRPQDPSHIDIKDGGLDFVVWKRIPDGRKGHLFLLGQCACGHDWTEKFYDIDVQLLTESWVRPLSVAQPLRVFTTPHHIPNRTQFADVNNAAGLTMDRARIVLLAEDEANQAAILKAVKDPLPGLISLVIPGFAVV